MFKIFGVTLCRSLLRVAVLLFAFGSCAAANLNLVNEGRKLYDGTTTVGTGVGSSGACIGCHYTSAPPTLTQGSAGQANNHNLASNNGDQITTAINNGYMVFPGITATQRFQLSLYIAQYKAPAAISSKTLGIRAGVASGTLDVYQFLPIDGSSGVAKDSAGVTAVISGASPSGSVAAVVNNPSTSSIQYNITYTPAANFVGTETIDYKIINPAATSPVANHIDVTVYGITNTPLTAANLTATAKKGVASANVFTVTSNDPGAVFSSSNLTTLTGLSIDANTGVISGTPNTTGAIDVTVTASTPAVGGSVSRTLTITIAGITSANAVNYSQNVAIAPYTITAFPSTTSPQITAGALPTGLSIVGGVISGTPTVPGSFPVTIQADSGSGLVSQALAITVGPIPVITSTPASNAAPTVTVIGSTGAAILNIQINATTPPAIAGSSYIATGINAITGLIFNATTGLISGTPSVSGDFPVVLGASNTNGQGILNVVFRVNAGAAPNISSAASAGAVSVGSTGTVYTIATNTNGPIVSYGIVAPSVLPSGLALNTTTGVVSGTPGTSGTFQTTLSATNSGNFTGTKVVTFTINPTSAPVITSPTFATLAVGVPMTPLQIVATNPPILSYGLQSGSTLPVGLSLDTATGIISGTPTTPGPVTATLKATNVVNFGVLAVPFSVGVPTPTNCVMTVPLNTATTLDLKPCMFPAFVPAGVSVLATPSHGSVVVSGTTVTYTPVKNYFGIDSFTTVASFAGGGTSTAGLVSVTITGRPDPTHEVAVTATLGAQTATVQQFSRAQVSNFQKRMESLHPRGSSAGGAPTLQYKGTGDTGSRSFRPGAVASPSASVDAAKVAATNPLDPIPVPVPMSTAQGVDTVAAGLGLKALPFADTVASLLTSRSVNLASLVGGNGLPNSQGSISYWVEGVATFGSRDAVGAVSGYEFSSSGISVGADRRINDLWAVGIGLGYGRDKTIIGTDGSQNDGRGYSLATYASYQPSPGIFLDGMIGIGSIDFDTRRYVASINDFAYGNRKGTQIFGSLSAAYEKRQGGVMVSPYGRLDFSSSKLLDSTETGAGAYALTYFEQTIASLQGAVGVRAESIHSASFGWAIPRVRAEFRHEFQGEGDAFISYADQIGGTRYAIAGASAGRDSFVMGIGSDFILRDGWTLGVDYQLSQSSAQESSYAIRFRITKDFDAMGLPKLMGEWADTPSKPIDVQVDAGYAYDDNVTRAKAGPDQRADSSYSVNVSKTKVFNLSEQSRVVLTGSIGGERFQNFNGLSRLSAGVEGEIQYRESSEFDAPTLGVFGRLTADQFQSDLRDGYRYSLGVSLRQPLTDRISLFGALSHNERRARSAVFNSSDSSLRVNADYALSERETLYASGEYRRGDIVSTGRASLENVSVAKVFVQDDAFAGGQFFSYRFDGSTVLTTLGYNLGLGPRDSLDFSWRRVESTPSLRPSFVTSPKSYIDNQWSVTYLVRF